MKHILFPADFSSNSTSALVYALKFANAIHAEITIFHAFNESEPPLHTLSLTRLQNQKRLSDEIEFTIKESLFEVIHHVSNDTFTNKSIHYKAGVGHPTAEILKQIAKGKYDCVMMGNRGARTNVDNALGSVSATLILKSKIPVLIIPKDATFTLIKHMVLIDDLGLLTSNAIAFLKIYEKHFHPKFCLIHMATDKKSMEAFRMKNYHDTILKLNTFNNIELKLLQNKNVVDGVNHFVNENATDIIFVLNHKGILIDTAFGKTMGRDLTFQTKIPVFTLNI